MVSGSAGWRGVFPGTPRHLGASHVTLLSLRSRFVIVLSSSRYQLRNHSSISFILATPRHCLTITPSRSSPRHRHFVITSPPHHYDFTIAAPLRLHHFITRSESSTPRRRSAPPRSCGPRGVGLLSGSPPSGPTPPPTRPPPPPTQPPPPSPVSVPAGREPWDGIARGE